MIFSKDNNIQEDIEKHNQLNPLLWNDDATMKDEVISKLKEIADEFILNLQEAEIEADIDDIILIGSNANYNYTKNSDLDIHIILNNKDLEPKIAESLYGAYRSIFNKNYDISIYNIPVEIYVELPGSDRISNGVYSIKNEKWLIEPTITEIPDLDTEKFENYFEVWENKYFDLVADYEDGLLEDELDIVNYINEVYELRKKGLAKEGEYGIPNLIFKELRNRGYLDNLKEIKNKLISKRLSLEESYLTNRQLDERKIQIARACGCQPVLYNNGIFYIYNIKASDVNYKLRLLKSLDFVDSAQAVENGKYDFSNTFSLAMNRMPAKFYNIKGKINID